MYEVAPAVREGYSWARSNLYNIRIILTVGVVMFVGAYVGISPATQAVRESVAVCVPLPQAPGNTLIF